MRLEQPLCPNCAAQGLTVAGTEVDHIVPLQHKPTRWGRGTACSVYNFSVDEDAGDREILARCDAVLMTPDWARSVGATAEHEFALEHWVYSLASLRDWLDGSNDEAAA